MANSPQGISQALRVAVLGVLYIIFIFVLPIYFGIHTRPITLRVIIFYYFIVFCVFAFLIKRNLSQRYEFEAEIQKLEERMNVLGNENASQYNKNAAIHEKIARYNNLKEVVEEVNSDLKLDSVAERIASIAFSFIASNRGTCLLYLVDTQHQKLVLFKSRKEDSSLVIKAKEGDIFDMWVLRHSNPLFIEDVRKDFRFDLSKHKLHEVRQVASLISAPFMNGQRLLGILRLDHPDSGFYSQDDLRFLTTICDMGAVALENSELFQNTQALAIHDSLTGFHTKGFFMGFLKEECKRSGRQKEAFSLLMLDIDFFKKYNDKFGHTAGDIVLRRISEAIRECIGTFRYTAARFGGEEFSIILSGMDKKQAALVAEAIRRRVAQEKVLLRRQHTSVTVSVGVATFPADAAEEVELISRADIALYDAKQKGRNRVCCI